ncbi:hypothetical protein SAMN05443377_10239 [Propionibacterium cyclohexanicum]|uniref:Uncharacterized protein n=1 Tax=Propionibacterium cyclohexanicum TaxID=64702 RepID=A0A1H9PZF1_9ACTN|nr:hypothetical protein SAMN05443377_10239 [Propionibacterium cyclohexanicum]
MRQLTAKPTAEPPSPQKSNGCLSRVAMRQARTTAATETASEMSRSCNETRSFQTSMVPVCAGRSGVGESGAEGGTASEDVIGSCHREAETSLL